LKIVDNQSKKTPPHIEMNANGEELHLGEFLKTFKYNNQMKSQFIKDLKSINLKSWFHRSGNDVNFFFYIYIYYSVKNFFFFKLLKQAEIISIDLDKRLVDACEKMKSENLHRIIILDREKQLVVGTLTHRDILLFIIRNFKGKNVEYFSTPLLKLGVFGSLEKPITIKKTETLLMTFHFMLKNKFSSIPVVDEKEQYFGLINKSDMFFIIKDNLYEMVKEFF